MQWNLKEIESKQNNYRLRRDGQIQENKNGTERTTGGLHSHWIRKPESNTLKKVTKNQARYEHIINRPIPAFQIVWKTRLTGPSKLKMETMKPIHSKEGFDYRLGLNFLKVGNFLAISDFNLQLKERASEASLSISSSLFS